jgi:hypothetical protein
MEHGFGDHLTHVKWTQRPGDSAYRDQHAPSTASRQRYGAVAAYNFARRLKTLKGLTPYAFICKMWATQPERFRLNPLRQMPGLNS